MNLYKELKRRIRIRKAEHSPWWPGSQEEIIISAVLTQNTNWRNVEKALENLRRNGCLSIRKMISCPIKKLEEMIRPAGFFRQKARYLKSLSGFILPYLEKGEVPAREDLLKVRGIGKETADAILLYAFHQPEFVVDAYTIRLAERIWGKKMGYEKAKSFFSRMAKGWKEYAEFHGLIVEFSKSICRKRPECSVCFLREKCLFGR